MLSEQCSEGLGPPSDTQPTRSARAVLGPEDEVLIWPCPVQGWT